MLGSVTALPNNSGNIVETYSYDVYGNPSSTSSVGNPYFFTGRRYDTETGLYYYRARYYNAEIGRFLQTDPIGYLGGLNLYTYCGNNPVIYTDPYGLVVWGQFFRGIARMAGGAAAVLGSAALIGGTSGVGTVAGVSIAAIGLHTYGTGLGMVLDALADQQSQPSNNLTDALGPLVNVASGDPLNAILGTLDVADQVVNEMLDRPEPPIPPEPPAPPGPAPPEPADPDDVPDYDGGVKKGSYT